MQNTHTRYSFYYRMAIIWRCVFNNCPQCNKGPISSPFSFPNSCPHCQFVYDRGNGFLLSALPAVYFAYCLICLLPLIGLYMFNLMPFQTALIIAVIGAVLIPSLLFNYCKMLALALYYFFMAHELTHPEEWDELKP
jgi:uncharacterized protein (DUF983 family)